MCKIINMAMSLRVAQSSLGAAYILQKGAEVISMIRAPFKRRSATLPPSSSSRTDRSTSMPRSCGSSSSVNSLDNVYAEIDINTALVSSTNTNNTIAIAICDTADSDTNHDIQSNVFDSIPSLNILDCDWGNLNASQMNLFSLDSEVGQHDVVAEDSEPLAADCCIIADSVDTSVKEKVPDQDFVQDEVEVRNKQIDSRPPPSLDAIDDGTYKVPKKIAVPYVNQEIADNLTKVESVPHLYDIDVKDGNYRATGAIKKIDTRNDTKKTPFHMATKSVNTLLSSIKERVMKTAANTMEIFEPIGEPNTADADTSQWPAIKIDDTAISMAHANTPVSPGSDEHKFNDMKNRFKQKLKFGFRFTSNAKKAKICQRCLLPPRPITPKSIVNRANRDIGSTHDATETLLDSTQYYYCTCDIDFGDKDHYSDLIGVSICYFFIVEIKKKHTH